jgi:DNA-binding NarL/FixJ family response regulator
VISTTIFIISPHLMFGSGLESLLGRETRLAIVGRERNIEQALEPIRALQPAVIILDSDELARNDLSGVVSILNVNPQSRVIGLSLRHNKAYTYQIIDAFVDGPEDLVQLITSNSLGSGKLPQEEAGVSPQDIPA